jgi:hypothetical protein
MAAWYGHGKIYLSRGAQRKNFKVSVLPEKLAGPQLVKKFPAFDGNGSFIAAFTKARHLSLS